MKYLKRFENNIDCKEGDYALFKYTHETHTYHAIFTEKLKDFINNNIGQIIVKSNDSWEWLSVRYDNIPFSIKNHFNSSDNSILLNKKNLVATSDTDEELRIKYDAKQYNL